MSRLTVYFLIKNNSSYERKRQIPHLLVNFSSVSLYVLGLHGQVLVAGGL